MVMLLLPSTHIQGVNMANPNYNFSATKLALESMENRGIHLDYRLFTLASVLKWNYLQLFAGELDEDQCKQNIEDAVSYYKDDNSINTNAL